VRVSLKQKNLRILFCISIICIAIAILEPEPRITIAHTERGSEVMFIPAIDPNDLYGEIQHTPASLALAKAVKKRWERKERPIPGTEKLQAGIKDKTPGKIKSWWIRPEEPVSAN